MSAAIQLKVSNSRGLIDVPATNIFEVRGASALEK